MLCEFLHPVLQNSEFVKCICISVAKLKCGWSVQFCVLIQTEGFVVEMVGCTQQSLATPKNAFTFVFFLFFFGISQNRVWHCSAAMHNASGVATTLEFTSAKHCCECTANANALGVAGLNPTTLVCCAICSIWLAPFPFQTE